MKIEENSVSLPQNELKQRLGMEVTSLAELVTRKIRDLIITGDFKPGQQLKEEELCELFAISRPPIREAFKTLEASGLVTRKPRKGVSVVEFKARDVEEVYTIIALLYQKATEMAMGVINDHHLELLASQLEIMEKSVKGNPPKLRDYQSAHTAFHETIMELAGNERMQLIEKQLRYQLSIFSYKSLQDQDHLSSSLEYHRRILQAIRDKERENALALVSEHIMVAMKLLMKKLSN